MHPSKKAASIGKVWEYSSLDNALFLLNYYMSIFSRLKTDMEYMVIIEKKERA